MSGHSKWKNIAHRKGAVDAKRAKIFTKYSREMIIAIRDGGADPASNTRLAAVIVKAKSENVPNDNINRILQKYQSGAAAENYEYIDYEGYGPAGVAVIAQALTDNRVRTVSEVRHAFDKYGGNMGSSGCVSWQFDQKGVIVLESQGQDEDALMMLALEAGASDFLPDGDIVEIITEPGDLDMVVGNLKAAGLELLEAQVEMVPQTYVKLTREDDVKNMQKMLDILEQNDDIQNVWHNWEN